MASFFKKRKGDDSAKCEPLTGIAKKLKSENDALKRKIQLLEKRVAELEEEVEDKTTRVHVLDKVVRRKVSSTVDVLIGDDNQHNIRAYARKLKQYIEKKHVNEDLAMAQLLFFSTDSGSVVLPSWWQLMDRTEKRLLDNAPMYVLLSKDTLQILIDSVNKLKNYINLVREVQRRTVSELHIDNNAIIGSAIVDTHEHVCERFPAFDFSNTAGTLSKLIGTIAVTRLWANDDRMARKTALRLFQMYREECFTVRHSLEHSDATALFEMLADVHSREDRALRDIGDNLLKALNVEKPETLALNGYTPHRKLEAKYKMVVTRDEWRYIATDDAKPLNRLRRALVDKQYDILTLSPLCELFRQMATDWRRDAMLFLRDDYDGDTELEKLPLFELMDELKIAYRNASHTG